MIGYWITNTILLRLGLTDTRLRRNDGRNKNIRCLLWQSVVLV